MCSLQNPGACPGQHLYREERREKERRKRVIFIFVNPFWGHINPLLDLVRELTVRGFTVRVYSGTEAAGAIEQSGGVFVDCTRFFLRPGPIRYEASGYLNALEAAMAMDEFMADQIRVWKPVYAVSDIESIWGSLLAEKYRLPLMIFSPTHLRSLFAAGDYWGEFFKELEPYEEAFERRLQLLSENGFPKKSMMSLLCMDPDKEYIAAVPGALQPCRETIDADRVRFCGGIGLKDQSFVIRSPRHRPLIYVTLGTTYFSDAHVFYRSCIEAFRHLDIDVIMSVWKYVDIRQLGEAPENIDIRVFVDQTDVLRQCDAALFIGGINTVKECLMLGVPMVIRPFFYDNFATAKLIREAGAGVRIDGCRPDLLRSSVMRVLTEPSFREQAAVLGEIVRKSHGTQEAAEWILTHLTTLA